jgi:hypothetical protein
MTFRLLVAAGTGLPLFWLVLAALSTAVAPALTFLS